MKWLHATLLCGMMLISTLALAPFTEARQTTLWQEGWEGDWTRDWHVDAGTWEVGTPTSGPKTCHEGAQCSGTVLAGNYAEGVDTRLIRHTTFVVPPASDHPRLRFWHWFSFGGGDLGQVQLSTDGGATWDTLSVDYTGTSSGVWTRPALDLSAYAGQTVQLAFFLQTRDTCTSFGCTNPGAGWFIDDVVVVSGPMNFPNPMTFEAGLEAWKVDLGTWEVGSPTSGPNTCHEGAQCVGTVLAGNYAEGVDTRLISPPFRVPDAEKNPVLRFWHWFSFGGGDDGTPQISLNDGETWIDLSDSLTGTSSGVWSNVFIPLTAYAGQEARLAFFLQTRDTCTSFGCTNPGAGWFIDEVLVEGFEGTGVATENTLLPPGFVLHGAYPNPFNPTTTLRFDLDTPATVSLRVFDMLGRTVDHRNLGRFAPGAGLEVRFDGGSLPSGIYVYRLEARSARGVLEQTGRFVLLK